MIDTSCNLSSKYKRYKTLVGKRALSIFPFNQEIKYECFLSALQEQGVDFGFWLDRYGDNQIYWTGANYGKHVCSCHYSENGCFDADNLGNTCNCDSIKPAELSDIGSITNSTALPITGIFI